MARRRAPVRRASRPRRRYEWARRFIDFDMTPANTTFVANLLDDYEQVLGADAAGTTITRIRGHLNWFWADSAQKGGLIAPVVGIKVSTDPPSGLTDAQQTQELEQHYADWMFYDTPAVASSIQGQLHEYDVFRQPIDIRSQRRFDELQQSLRMYIGTPGLAAGAVHVTGFLNILLKQP